MGKQVKRVALNFDWRMNKTWWGYELPEVMCQVCAGRGNQVKLLTWEHLSPGDLHLFVDRERCPTCDGRGRIRPIIEVPVGTGYQLWDTSFAGCPISPVFKSPEELACWLSKEQVHAFTTFTLPYEKWLAFITEKNEMLTNFIKSDLDQSFDRLDDRVMDFIDRFFGETD